MGDCADCFMNLLVDINHPAHVHLFRNLISHYSSEHHVVTVIRNKDVTTELLDHHGIDYLELSTPGHGLAGWTRELIERDRRVLQLYRELHFDLAVGCAPLVTHLSLFTGTPSLVFEEDDDAVVPIFSLLRNPFATGIISPNCMKYRGWERKRIFHNSYHELAYLHPEQFTPDQEILTKYDLTPGEYVMLRFSALDAHHDVGAEGISPALLAEIRTLLDGYRQMESVEYAEHHRIDPGDMHHVLAYAKLVISDSQTVTAEAAVLGVPSVRYNSFVGKISYLNELERRYHLTYGYRPGNERRFLGRIRWILQSPGIHKRFAGRRAQMLHEKTNLHHWMIRYIDEQFRRRNPGRKRSYGA